MHIPCGACDMRIMKLLRMTLTPNIFHWSIWETVTFLDLGFHETKQEEFDGNIKDIE